METIRLGLVFQNEILVGCDASLHIAEKINTFSWNCS